MGSNHQPTKFDTLDDDKFLDLSSPNENLEKKMPIRNLSMKDNYAALDNGGRGGVGGGGGGYTYPTQFDLLGVPMPHNSQPYQNNFQHQNMMIQPHFPYPSSVESFSSIQPYQNSIVGFDEVIKNSPSLSAKETDFRDQNMNCSDVGSHVKDCDICTKVFDGNKYLYLLTIIFLVLIIVFLMVYNFYKKR